ncbi:MAG: DUF4012 domain-containing protein, partial [Anaerolinea sp.]|nr:DUF4012 domain-containing protein [Anaerolinea sp.]
KSTLGFARSQTRLLRPLQGLRADIDSTIQLIDGAYSMLDAADSMLNGMQPALSVLFGRNQDEPVAARISQGERLVERMRIGRTAFLRADEQLRTARNLLDQVTLEALPVSYLFYLNELNSYYELLQNANEVLLNSPELLTAAFGLGTQQNYLILSQNSDELRPSGGYISTYGWLSVRNGRVVDYGYNPTTPTSPNPPPETLQADFHVPEWWIQYNTPIYASWDGSWAADFPTTARMAMWFYDNGSNLYAPIDGVIAIDIFGFEAILSALGSVRVPGYTQAVTTGNFRDVVYTIRAEEGEHKAFLAAMYTQIFSDWQDSIVDPEINQRMLGVVLQALQEKHIMLFFNNESLNTTVQTLGWAGNQAPQAGTDYLMVADANLGNKSNRSIIRQLSYNVQIQADGTLQSELTVDYDYSARIAEADPAVDPEHHGDVDYQNLLQVYVPQGSVLDSTENLSFAPTVEEQPGYTDFIADVVVTYDSVEQFQFNYTTPVTVLQDFGTYQRYQLLVQKQPGTRGDLVNVQVFLPPGATLVDASPDPTASYTIDQTIIEFDLNLRMDQTVTVIYAP